MRKKKNILHCWITGPRSGNLSNRGGKAGSNSHDHLLTAQQRVADELASSKRHGAVVVRHGCGCGDGLIRDVGD